MKAKPVKVLGISAVHKEALAKIASLPEFKVFLDFLRIQQNNIVMLEWFRVLPEDPLIREKKAKYDGMFEMIKNLINAFEESKKDEE